MRSNQRIDYPKLGKYGSLAGAALFLVGLVGEFLGHTLTQHLPAWEDALLTYMLGFGLLLAFVSFFFVFIGGTLVQS